MFLSYKTDIGLKRNENQDRVYAEFLDNNVSISVVCDGMGGASSGGVASQLAIDSFVSRIKENFRKDMSENSIRNMMLTSAHFANTVVYESSKADIEKNGMGTTIVAALVIDKKIYVISVGDSRAYLMNKDEIKQITTDHTYVEMLYRNGEITEEEKETHELRNVITRAIGVESDVDVDYFEIEAVGNFTVLLCSDGLSKYCSSDYIYNTVFEKNLDQAAAKLISYSNDCGGKDNITVAIVAN